MVTSVHEAQAGADATPLERALSRAHGILPDQGPIGVFVHHNTLHAFQHLPFHEGVQAGAALLAARPYLDIHEFRAAWRCGRIEEQDADAAIRRTLGSRADDVLPLGLTRQRLWSGLLRDVIDEDDEAGLAFVHRAGGSLYGAALRDAAESRLVDAPPLSDADVMQVSRHRDVMVARGAADPDVPVHGELVRLCSVFLDHGQAMAEMPCRAEGFLRAVALQFATGATEPAACRGLRQDMLRVMRDNLGARAVITETLIALGVGDAETESFLLATALALPGWTGMFARLERHPEEIEGPASVTLADMLAVRLLCDRRAIETLCAHAGLSADWQLLRAQAAPDRPVSGSSDAWILAGIATTAGATPEAVRSLPDEQLQVLRDELRAFPRLLRRRVLHEAWERRYRRQILDGLHALRPEIPATAAARPAAQFVFCIDEREESVRRALEEQSSTFETFGVAGFFGVAIDYLGLYDDTPAAHCPVVITPAHEVHESAVAAEQHWHLRRTGLRDRWNAASRMVHRQSRTLSGGAGLSFVLGPVAAAIALSRVIAPRTSLALADSARERFVPRPSTRLSAIRPSASVTVRSERGKFVGFSLEEAVDRVSGVLRAIGLTVRFAPIVVILGHGSTSLNNPHESAHDCGACGGRRGGGNARLFAEMANSADVRISLRAQGIPIPDDTWFVGGLHDTADDAVTLYDLEYMPAAHAAVFQRAHDALDAARRESAAERCRRFVNAPLGLSPDAALRHVEGRASHLAQPRPEYGHCTNAICIVGRRSISRGLHLDRRAFLVSYDPGTDDDAAILTRILTAVGPVGAGISLEYYFSSVDNERFGCGTKLPHNVTGLVGVMAGHQSDLRTGLPLQMVEIHEPMRLLLIVDATVEALLTVASRVPEVAELVVNEWVQLVSCDPATGAMSIFADGTFVPYAPSSDALVHVKHSRDWHMRSRDHLPPAIVTSALRVSDN